MASLAVGMHAVCECVRVDMHVECEEHEFPSCTVCLGVGEKC